MNTEAQNGYNLKGILKYIINNWFAILFLFFVSVIIFSPIIGRFGNDQVGSFFERDNYQTKYYINLFTKKDISKNYRLVADLEKITDCVYIARDERECSHTYYVRQIYWPNSSYFTFDNDECIIKSKDKNLCFPDQQKDGVYIEPTNQKASKKK